MSLRIVGAGLPRTGTSSLKLAIEHLTGEPCYHMFELLERADAHVPLWSRVLGGDLGTFDQIFEGFGSAVDWPAAVFWRELSESNPDAIIVLTYREDAETWWRSVDTTVWRLMRERRDAGEDTDWIDQMRGRFHAPLDDPAGAMAAYERHNDEVRASIAPDRLVEVTPGDGWAPLCAALGVEAPADPYPHANTTAEFHAFAGWA
ncbi:MAG: sulfotransferase family protein [Acidimicrobiales bacterium]